MIDINKLKNKFIAYRTECSLILQELEKREKEFNELNIYSKNLQEARIIIAETGKVTQTQLKILIEEMVTTALHSVFEEDYQFVINFDIKRNRPEAKISLKIRGEEADPKDSVGGGVLDIASFALRVVLYSIQNPKSDNVLILDESFKFLHGNIENVSKMLKELSKKLNIQFIIVSQIEELSENADKVFLVTHNGKYSIVKEINNIIN